MICNEAGLELIKESEGLKLEAYYCPAGKLTIGYGHTGTDVTPHMAITLGQAERLLDADLERVEEGIEALVKVPLSANQFSALCSFAYNLGLGALGGSTLLRKLNQQDYSGAALEFLRWDHIGQAENEGLKTLRTNERALFLTA